jgi:hypothetical protein
MNIPNYDSTDLCCDVYLKHRKLFDNLGDDGVLADDIIAIIDQAYGDGYCRGYNAANEWYTAMDADIEYIKSFDSGQGVDTFNDDLMGSAYGDVPNIQDLREYDDLFNKRNKNG